MKMKEWRNDVINSEERIAMPIMTHPGIDMIGKTVIDAVKNGEVQAEAILALNKKYPSAAFTLMMDLTVEAEAFGADVQFKEDEVPSVIGRLLSNADDVNSLQIPSLKAGRIQEYLKVCEIIVRSKPDKPVFGGSIGPFSLAGRLFDMTEIMMAIYIEPDTIKQLLDKCTQFLIDYIRAFKETGADGIVIADPAAGLLSNDDAIEFSSNYVRKITDELQDDKFMIIFHNCGNSGHCTQSMVLTGAHALHFGNKIDMKEALLEVPEDILVMGNIDPVSVFKQGTEAKVKSKVHELLHDTANHKNFVLSSGCDLPPAVPLANLDAFYEELSLFNS